MSEPLDFTAPHDSIEAMIRSAQDFVRPSDDLRPRVLEVARVQSLERQAARHFWQVAAIVLLCGSLAASFVREQQSTALSPFPTVSAAGQLVAGADAAARSGDAGWQMVESFTQLRLRQAQLLRM